MTNANEIAALGAAYRGALSTAESLAGLSPRIGALEGAADIDPALLADLARIAAGHAVASAALRGLVESMQRRRTPPAP